MITRTLEVTVLDHGGGNIEVVGDIPINLAQRIYAHGEDMPFKRMEMTFSMPIDDFIFAAKAEPARKKKKKEEEKEKGNDN